MDILTILWYDILPLFAFMGCGWFLDSMFKIDISTYTKLTVYVVLPCFIFSSLYNYEADPSALALVPMAVLLMVVLYFLSRIVAKKIAWNKEEESDFPAITTFSNAGNIGIALVMMIFSHEPFLVDGKTPYLHEAAACMALLMLVTNVAVNTFGAAMVRSSHACLTEVVKYFLKMPALYGAILGILVKLSGFSLDGTFLHPVLVHFDGAFLVLIMVTVGAELHRTKWIRPNSYIWAAAAMKLLVCPALAYLLLLFIPGLSPVARQVFFIAAAVPSSMTLIIYGVEYKANAALLTQSVIWNLVLSTITMTGAIYLARILFPIG